MNDLAIYLPGILLSYLTFVVAASSPGPATIGIMNVSMKLGRPQGIIFALGIISGSFIWALLAATGLTQLLEIYGFSMFIIKIVGGLYLLWLAYKSFRSMLAKDVHANQLKFAPDQSVKKLYLQGLALHLTNPKPVFGWAAIVSIGLKPEAPIWVVVSIVLGCISMSVIIFVSYAFLFSSKKMIHMYKNARKPIEGFLTAIFGLAGIKLLSS